MSLMKCNSSRAVAQMSEDCSPERVGADVLAHIQLASKAVRRQDMAGMTERLEAAVTLYEQHPSHVHAPTSHLGDLLMCIRSGRGLCSALGQPDEDLGALEKRAEALRQPLH